MQETEFWHLGQEDPLEKEMATCQGKSHGQKSLAGYRPWGLKSQTWLSDKTTTKEKKDRKTRSLVKKRKKESTQIHIKEQTNLINLRSDAFKMNDLAALL